MSSMFSHCGAENANFTLNLGDKFYTPNVTDMLNMFYNVGSNNPNLVLDLSNFDFTNVTSYNDMFLGWTSSKKIYVKNATDQAWVIARNSNLTTSNVLIKS